MGKSTHSLDQRPNIIVIMTDQQRWDTIAALGHDHMITPNMDRLAKRGVAFTQAFASGVTCVASRASMFTGMYPHNTGVYSFESWAHHRNWVHDLADHNYHCVNIGKMHFLPRDAPGGFHERIIVENPTGKPLEDSGVDDDWGRFLSHHGQHRPNDRHRTDPQWMEKLQGVPWHLDERFHSDAFVGDAAVAWAHRHRPTKPVFVQIGFPGPHEPWDPPVRCAMQYEKRRLPKAVGGNGELDSKPPQHEAMARFFADTDHEARIGVQNASNEQLEHMRRHYYGKITFVDEQLGKVIDALEAQGYLDHALVVFCSDHGEMLGDHGLPYKWLMYDGSVRVPLIVWDTRTEVTGERVDDLVSLLDVGPTIVEAAGIDSPTYLEGRSLLPYLHAEARKLPPRQFVFAEDNYQIMMRSKEEKLVYYLGQDAGEFYDLVNDPNELTNLWDDSAWADRKQQRLNGLLQWFTTSTYWTGGYKRDQSHYQQRWPNKQCNALHGLNKIQKPEGIPDSISTSLA